MNSALPRIAERCFLFWIIGTALLGKSFSYLSIGPLFITEIVLGILIVTQWARVTVVDVLFFLTIVFFVCAGLLKGFPFLFVGKDLSILYYLLFLRFCPTQLSSQSVKIIIASVAVGLFLGVTGIVNEEKYKFAVLLFFLGGILHLNSSVRWIFLLPLAYLVIGFLINFKTVLILAVLAPFIPWVVSKRLFSAKVLIPAGMFGFSLIYAFTTDAFMGFVINFVNVIADVVGVNYEFSANTAVWRSVIWQSALKRLFMEGQFILGTLPGFNFMDASYLGTSIELFGGNNLGVVRTAHNFIVQIVMKTGLLGLVIFAAYFSYSLPKNISKPTLVFIVLVMVCALTSDIFEVPSRGPLFFVLVHVLNNLQSSLDSKKLLVSTLPRRRAFTM